jgi:hypothetical protein
MSGITTYEENRLLDIMLGNGTPATVYVGLCTGVAANGTITGEPSGNNYARIALTNNATNFPAASAGSKSNGTQINFNVPSGSWGTLTTFFVSDSASGNTNTKEYCTITTITPGNGDTVKIVIGGTAFTLG